MKTNTTTQNEERIEAPVFNMATAYLIRVNKILISISTYSINSQYEKLFNSLMALYREISPYVTKDNKDAIEKKFSSAVKHYRLDKNYTSQAKNIRGYSLGSKKKEIIATADKEWSLFTNILNDLNITLKGLVHSSGLLMPAKKNMTKLGGETN